MTKFTVILIGIAIIAGMSSVAIARAPFNLQSMTCNITTPDTNDCTGMPTLQSGVLTLAKTGTFKLKALYNGCFIVENVTKSGIFQGSHFKETTHFELLTTQMIGIKNNATDFPRTLGFANLNNNNLDGYLIDISVVMRTYGQNTDNIVTAKLQCAVNE
ncbi:hypothetical protein SAMN05216302_100116 [Nitrosomonas aestuarii]|uniref:Uncharacterized protein n=1 Tax=Nitrosomonas aestuarii TaxID=52441 RepID=A0A1I3WZK0_9PROT|nr:hypothetical protein [Nitrosomonas aestuarii]SFK12036.1 hypothetical protein SAMN05216302_100116 [Nitrosomonas aestuarii]